MFLSVGRAAAFPSAPLLLALLAPRDCHWAMLLCIINGVCLEGRAGQQEHGNTVLTHAFQGMEHYRPPPTGSVLLEGCAELNMGKHQMANLITIFFQVRLPPGL